MAIFVYSPIFAEGGVRAPIPFGLDERETLWAKESALSRSWFPGYCCSWDVHGLPCYGRMRMISSY